MKLKQHGEKKELWTDGSAGRPGLYAVVIGASAYAAPNRLLDDFSLPQLNTTSLSAWNFFEWLQSGYAHPDFPLRSCRLLLTPGPQEIEHQQRLKDAPAADYSACESAIAEWHADVQQLHPKHQAASRAFFFFAGHGIEVYQGDHILLPSDYLAKPARSLNHAIRTQNVISGMSDVHLDADVYFFDACRASAEALTRWKVTGNAILDEHSRTGRRNGAVVFYATGPGGVALEPTSPLDGTSFFSSALVRGLGGSAGTSLCDDAPDHVTSMGLLAWLTTEARSRVRAYGEKAGGALALLRPLCVTQRPAHLNAPPDPGAFRGSESEPERDPADGGAIRGGGLVPQAAAPETDFEITGLNLTPDDGAGLHRALGHEWLTEPFTRARAHLLDDLARRAVIDIAFVARAGEHAYRVHFSLSEPAPCWIQMDDPWQNRTYGALLNAGGTDFPPAYVLEFVASRDRSRLEQPELRLDPDANVGALRVAARAWDFHRVGAYRRLLQEASAIVREDPVPLAAAVVHAALFRDGLLRHVDGAYLDWLRDAEGVSGLDLTDLPLFSQCREMEEPDRREESEDARMAEWSELLSAMPTLPTTTAGLGALVDVLRELRIGLARAEEAAPEEAEGLPSRAEKVDAAMHACTGIGLFCVYSGPLGSISSDLVRLSSDEPLAAGAGA